MIWSMLWTKNARIIVLTVRCLYTSSLVYPSYVSFVLFLFLHNFDLLGVYFYIPFNILVVYLDFSPGRIYCNSVKSLQFLLFHSTSQLKRCNKTERKI